MKCLYCTEEQRCGKHVASGGRALKGRIMSEETKRKVGAASKAMWMDPEFRKRRRMGGWKLSEETRRRMSKARAGVKKGPISEARRRDIINIMRAKWQDPKYVRMQMQARNRTNINKLESGLLGILEPLGFSFVGGGQLIVGGRCPDFWDGGNRLIEVYGNYWHPKDDSQKRVDLFKQYGYDCLVVWESELRAGKFDRLLEFAGAAR